MRTSRRNKPGFGNRDSGIGNPEPGVAGSPRTPNPEPRVPIRVPLYPYQERWVRDGARFKLAVKATQIGYSFAAALEAVLDCLEHRTLWIVLLRSERQSLEFMQKVREHAQALRVAASALETSFFEKADLLQHEVKFPNGSRIIGLPANPDTARGYTGNMILDEFAFHQQDREIWAAAFGRISRGDLKLRVLSTPNGQRGKYFELAKETGLATRDSGLGKLLSAESRTPNPESRTWSAHWCDVHSAVAQGCPMDIAALRAAIGDEETWQQEYECVFLSQSENYIPLDLILECQHPEASTAFPSGFGIRGSGFGTRSELGIRTPESRFPSSHSLLPIPHSPLPTPESRVASPESREVYFGYDVGRVRDLAVLAVVEKVGDVFWTRALVEMPGATFAAQEQVLSDVIPLCLRGAVDSTGLGMEMAERLAARFPGRVEPLPFTLGRKQELAIGMKRHFEERTIRIPDHRELRRDLNAVKRIITGAGNIRFDAERTDQGHADRFWALALALHAASHSPRVPAACAGLEGEREWYATRDGIRESGFGIRDSGTNPSRMHESPIPEFRISIPEFPIPDPRVPIPESRFPHRGTPCA